jgi:ubiquinone/menaquinone biosynthesis C-methylase UbiE
MIRLADQQRRRTKLDIEFLDLPGERIPLENGSVDTVVSTFTLCTVPGVLEALQGVRRVLRPGGKFIFFEHGLSPDPRVQRWQRWSEPIPYRVFEGCHVTRDIPSLISQSGFKIEQMEKGYLAAFPKSWSYYWWGSALPESQ